MNKLKPYLPLLLILFLSLILRVVYLLHYGNFWDDEMFNLIYSQKAWPLGLKYWLWETNPPLLLLTLKIWFKIFPATEFFTRLPSLIAGVGTVYLTYLLGNKLFNKKIGLLAAFYLAINPFHIFWSVTARAYAALMLFSVWSAWYFYRLYFSEENTPAIRRSAAVVNFFLIFSHLSSLFLLAGQFLILIVTKGKKGAAGWIKNNLIPFILGAIWIGSSLLIKLGNDLGNAWFFNLRLSFKTFIDPLVNMLYLQQKFIPSIIFLAIAILILGIALYKDIKQKKIIFPSFVVLILVPLALAGVFGVWHIKFFMGVLPLAMVALAYALYSFTPRGWIIYFFIALVSFIGLQNLWHMLPITNWQNVGQFIAENKRENTAILCNNFFLKTQIDYYLPDYSSLFIPLTAYQNLAWDDAVVKKNYIFKKLSEAEKEEWYKRNQIDKYSSIILLQDQKDYMNKIDDVLTKYGWILKKEPVDAQICGDYYLYLYEKTK